MSIANNLNSNNNNRNNNNNDNNDNNDNINIANLNSGQMNMNMVMAGRKRYFSEIKTLRPIVKFFVYFSQEKFIFVPVEIKTWSSRVLWSEPYSSSSTQSGADSWFGRSSVYKYVGQPGPTSGDGGEMYPVQHMSGTELVCLWIYRL